jgi:hypothetical protein
MSPGAISLQTESGRERLLGSNTAHARFPGHNLCFFDAPMQPTPSRKIISRNVPILLGLALLGLGACSKPAVAPVPTAEDRRIAKQAIALSDVLLRVRGGEKEKQVAAEVTRRRVPELVDSATENKLLDAGATSALIATLKAPENVLTPAQKIAYDEQQAEQQRVEQQDLANRRQAAASEEAARLAEIQRRQFYQQQTFANIRQRETQQAQYEQAERSYKSQRQLLEQQVQSLEASINRRRGYGYNENDLRADVQTLDRYREQLRNLTAPLRPL